MTHQVEQTAGIIQSESPRQVRTAPSEIAEQELIATQSRAARHQTWGQPGQPGGTVFNFTLFQ